eukprot:11225666-Lingulodinium_polyedra.AAC.1
MLVYPTASVTMPCLRPHPNQQTAKRALHDDKMGMDVDAIGTATQSLMHRKAEMRVSPRRNERFAAGTKRRKRKSND